ncbi:MAG: lytic transglycosylase domain-containing protein [Nanoarchaeota archaeon]|nr:lytic transglycosylase domain-containing protein [Nanoarchaeota archaeon]MBU1622899.1 lytic transglycosylase domain-containing protein [Nanoarchaeota archaeon]MBU1974259.1 lytic transglycosylase domain-containing protein [Nanoarchaeota archaeon]
MREYIAYPLALALGILAVNQLPNPEDDEPRSTEVISVTVSPEELNSLENHFQENRPQAVLLPKRVPSAYELEQLTAAVPEEPNPDKYDYSHPRIVHFYNLYIGERSRDIQTRIERTEEYAPLIRAAAENNDIPYETLLAQIALESGGDPNACNDAGDTGLTQINDITVEELERLGYDCTDRTDPRTSIECGAFYLSYLKERFGSLDLGLVAYNRGQGNVSRRISREGSNDFWEIYPEDDYVPRIRAVEQILNQ